MILKEVFPGLKIHNVETGKKVFDWKIPKEWIINDAWIKDSNDKKIIDFKKNNLHVVGYSHSINKILNLKQLKKKLYSIKNQPNAIPYVTSYYKKNWGFCITQNQKKKLSKEKYKVHIDSKFKHGSLTYGEILIPGKSKREIFISTYLCHPSLANNELSGPTLTIFLAKWIKNLKNRKFSYRIIFIPETIGSIAYIQKNLSILKKNTLAGFNITCVGDNRTFSLLPSRKGNTVSDKIICLILKKEKIKYNLYSWLDRGSDERQYCSPGVDLPVASLMRSKYGTYKEYHTSLDNYQNVVTAAGLNKSFTIYKKIFLEIEKNIYPIATYKCEPHLSKRNLYPSISKKNNLHQDTKLLLDILSFSDGETSLKEMSRIFSVSIIKIKKNIELLKRKKLIN